jgi:hypothetical protein
MGLSVLRVFQKIKKKAPGAVAVRIAVIAAVATPVMLVGVQAADAGWTLQSPAVPAGSTESGFYSVSCPSTTMCMAVGTFSVHGVSEPLAEMWNGTTWTIEATPTNLKYPQLDSVSCVSATDCTAVGTYFLTYGYVTLAEHWDGTSWTVQTTPNPPGNPTDGAGLTSVSCPSASRCMAMGETFAERWNGTAWKLLKIPSTGTLRSVSCRSGNSCLAVGSAASPPDGTTPFAASWNGSAWTAAPAVVPSGFNDAYLYDVSCGSATSCTAIGAYGSDGHTNLTLAEAWNGTTWALQSTAPLGTVKESVLNDVDCAHPGSCTAVGTVRRVRLFKTLSEHWTGMQWRLQTTVQPTGSTGSGLSSVSCPSEKFCVAVGSYDTKTARPGTVLAEQINQS